jgi:hypothetical protein
VFGMPIRRASMSTRLDQDVVAIFDCSLKLIVFILLNDFTGLRGWQKTLTGYPKELYDFWEKHLKDRGYKVGFQIVDFPGGRPGDIGITLRWK